MSTPTDAEIRRALRGPRVAWPVEWLPDVVACDVRPGRTPNSVTVMAVKIIDGRVQWAKRIPLSPLDDKVIALRCAEQRN
jgi:hypothetical protein